MDPVASMDRMYRLQRHWYDFSRKYYLLGRDRLVRQMEIKPGERVLEIACGTARNLILLSRLHPQSSFYGVDASHEMLKTAARNLSAAKADGAVQLRQGLAETLSYESTFGLSAPFDAVFFSYGLSMIPCWREAIDAALKNLKSGGTLYIVDFWDQRELPALMRRGLTSWLAIFGVHYRKELLDHLQNLAERNHAQLSVESVMRRYAFIARYVTVPVERTECVAEAVMSASF